MRDHSSDRRESRDKDSRERRHEKTERSARGTGATGERARHTKGRRLTTSRSRSRTPDQRKK